MLSTPRSSLPLWLDTVRIDTITAGLAGVYVGIFGPFLGLVAAKTLHASGPLLSAMMAAPFIGNMLIPLWAHRLHGRPKLPFVVIPAMIARSLYLLMALVHSAGQYVSVALVAQFCESSTGPGYSAVMERVYPQSRRGRIMSYVRVVRTLAAIATTVATGKVIDQWGFRPIFVTGAIFGLASSWIFATIRVPLRQDVLERRDVEMKRGAAWEILKADKAFRIFCFSVFVYGTGNLILMPIYPLFLANTLHVTYADQGILSFAGMVAAAFGFFGWGHFIDRHGPIRCVSICIGLVIARPIIYFFAPSYPWLLPAMILGGISDSGIEVGYLNSIIAFSPPAMVPAYQSLHASLLGIRGILAAAVAALLIYEMQLHSTGLRPAFLISLALIVIGYAMGRHIRPPAST